jgi:hypothetical protein
MPAALARCYTLVKMWDGQSPGALMMVEETIKKEMQRLLDIVRAYGIAEYAGYLLSYNSIKLSLKMHSLQLYKPWSSTPFS